jgi:polyisoprenoid-binding protein YceI
MKIIKNLIVMILLAGGFFVSTYGQANENVKYTILPQSKLYIDGTSTLHNFTINAKEVNGYLVMNKVEENGDAKTELDNMSELKVIIPVKKLDTDKSSMNDNMDEALKSEKAPDITYELKSVVSGKMSNNSNDPGKFITTGNLSIAGESKVIEMPVDGYIGKDGKLHFSGETTVKMTDFGVDPPTMLFGTIRTGDTVVVHFELVLSTENN